ncbi:MAG: hypothetical protein K2Y71_19265 [Xanthobacteraceae bacterium]|nr:hypothetical protein [Xanthobacteraceae bacterium]
MAKDAVEHGDVVAGKMARPEDEQVGDTAKRSLTALFRTIRKRIFKLTEKRILSAHR